MPKQKPQEEPTFTERFTEGPSLDALDEERMRQKIDETRVRIEAQEEHEALMERKRWERYRGIATGLPTLIERVDRAFRAFYAEDPSNSVLVQYDHLARQLRVAAALFQRDTQAMQDPSFGALETLQVQVEELERLTEAIHALDAHAPAWGDLAWQHAPSRERSQKRQQDLMERFGCKSHEIAYHDWEISPDTKVYDGPLTSEVVRKMDGIEHLLIAPSEREIPRRSVSTGNLRTLQDVKDVFETTGYPLSYSSLIVPPDRLTTSDFDVVYLTSMQIANDPYAFSKDIESKAASLGLDFLRFGEAAALQLDLLREGGLAEDPDNVLPNHMTVTWHPDAASSRGRYVTLRVNVKDRRTEISRGPAMHGNWYVVRRTKK